MRFYAINMKLENNTYQIVAIVHAETSTGVKNSIEQISTLIKPESIFLVDAVTSLGTINVEVDKWNIDAIYSCSQKGLSCPPGASPISFSDKAISKMNSRETMIPNWYLDMKEIIKYWEGNQRTYHHTAPINMMYALYQGLLDVVDEGMENILKRHQLVHEKLVNGLQNIGLEMLVDKESRLPSLNAIKIPEGIDDMQVRSKLLNDYHIEVGGGLGPFAGKVWRVGLMGYSAKEENVEKLLNAFKDII